MKTFIFAFIALSLAATMLMTTTSCSKKEETSEMTITKINKTTIDNIEKQLIEKYGQANADRIHRGVSVVASLWTGSEKDFELFCNENFVADSVALDALYQSVSMHFETLWGNFNKIALDLKRPMHLDIGEMNQFDLMMGGYDPAAHINADFFENKIAYYVALNFPFYSLAEKNELGKTWTRKQWAFARVGDMFTANIPAQLLLNNSEVLTSADNYISEYNIMMGYLVDDKMQTQFPEDMKLISHWNLRDELKSQYSKSDGLEKQKTIYEVMKRIITQTIPNDVINNKKYQWNPVTNVAYADGKEVKLTPEPNTRYLHLLKNFRSRQAIDEFNPLFPTFIEAKFNQEMEMPQAEVEAMFEAFVSSPVAKEVGDLIKSRLGRDLLPFDIWYDGFKTRSTMNQDDLTKTTAAKYPNPKALENDIPNILGKLGYAPAKAKEIASRISVDPARGAGHAWGAQMKGEKAHLRTRIAASGMDYKGYNIAIHELGHNVEQTLTLYDVDHYLLQGVPNTAFTEAWAFTFQSRDLQLLGIKSSNADQKHLDALDNFWSIYEIMGVSLVDMRVWKWLYANPTANEAQLKDAVIKIATEVWNEFYAPVFGVKDQPVLGIYSHMIDNPLYLSAYPIGHLIEFQIEDYVKDKNFANEMVRMCVQGRLTPKIWTNGAFGRDLSIEPSINAAKEALANLKK